MEYYTYDMGKQYGGRATKHKRLISAIIRAKYQSLILGFDSCIDSWDGEYTRTIKQYKGWTPFKKRRY